MPKAGPQSASEAQKDACTWADADGQAVARRVATWEEAHRVLVELEGIQAGGRALRANYSLDLAAFGGKGGGPKGGATKGQGSSEKKACWKMRGQGTCARGKDCPFSHARSLAQDAQKKGAG